MPDDDTDADDAELSRQLDVALAETQRLERAERDADMARQERVDAALSDLLARKSDETA